MARKRFRLGILAMVLVFGMASTGCNNPTGNNGSGSDRGIFTLTDIPPEHNGKYVFIVDTDAGALAGLQSFNVNTGVIILPRISNESVRVPMWKNMERYYGNDTVSLVVYIFATGTFSGGISPDDAEFGLYFSVSFSNGSVSKSFHDGAI